ncbi:MAG: hydrogenase small subunit [Proteobacteria bacterium]|nr:hydrogenase small subunit [Pseudomonadota bacterium]
MDESQSKLEKALEIRGISRRDFLKYVGMLGVMTGLSESAILKSLAQAAEKGGSGKLPVVWLNGQDCTGCTISLAGSLNPPVASLILDKLSIRYHETIMAASGEVAEEAYKEALKKGGYLLVVEGSIPEADDRFCMIGGRPFKEIVKEAAAKASMIVAVGACASFGGIPASTPSRGMGVKKLLPEKTVVNLSTCPVHPDHLVGTILQVLVTGKAPELDENGRPKIYFGPSVHDNCRRRSYFDASMFLKDWNDPAQKDYCLFEKGCKGPNVNSDCPIRRWNDGLNFCIDCGAGCQGCSDPTFYSKMTPLYTSEGEVSRKIWARKQAGLIPAKV